MYKIVFTKQVHKSLRRIPVNVVASIRKRLDQIAEDPYAQHPNVTKLQNRPGYRLRVGDWRVIYDIKENELIILVPNQLNSCTMSKKMQSILLFGSGLSGLGIKVGSRGEIYR